MIKITEEMIGCLCWFWYNDEDYGDQTEKEKILGILDKIDSDHWENYPNNSEPLKRSYFMKRDNQPSIAFPNCMPARPEEIKFYGINDEAHCLVISNRVLSDENRELKRENEKLRDYISMNKNNTMLNELISPDNNTYAYTLDYNTSATVDLKNNIVTMFQHESSKAQTQKISLSTNTFDKLTFAIRKALMDKL